MKLRIFRFLTICIILLSINPVLIVSAQGTETISIGSAEMNTGETVIIPITIADAVDVEGMTKTWGQGESASLRLQSWG